MDLDDLSCLGRDVRVGCLYNYCNAAILTGVIEVPNESVELETYDILEGSGTISFDVSEEARLACIGVSQHLRLQMRAQNLKMNRLWFYDYMEDEAFTSRNNNDEVYITAYLIFTRKYESIEEKFVTSNIAKYRASNSGCTHFVQEVNYGAEFVLWMHKPIDPSKETKQAAEQILRLELKPYLDQFFKPNLDPPVFNEELNSMNCSFQSSIRNGYTGKGTFAQCLRSIKELTNIKKNDRKNVWRPTIMQLCRIPTIVDIEIANALHADTVFDLKLMRQRFVRKSLRLIEWPSLRRVPFLKNLLCDFIKLLKPVKSTINEAVDKLRGKYFSPKHYSSITKPYVSLLRDALYWLKTFKNNMEKFDLVLQQNGLPTSLPILDLRSMNESKEGDYGNFKRVKVFVLHSNCVISASNEIFKTWAIYLQCGMRPPMFDVQMGGEIIYWENICEEFQKFLNEAQNSASDGVHYIVGILSPNSPYEEGSVFTMTHEETTMPICLPKPPAIAVDKPINSFAVENELPAVKNGQDCVTNNSSECKSNALSDAESKETECVPSSTRICEEFARTDRKHCQLLNTRPPNIFLLNLQHVFGGSATLDGMK